MTRNDKDLETFMAVAHEIAVEDALHTPSTTESRRAAEALASFARDELAARRRAERALRPARMVSGVIRPSILAMTRDAVLARLSVLWATHPEMQAAHRGYEGMSDEDLRSALEDAESLIEGLA